MGSSSLRARLQFVLDQFKGATSTILMLVIVPYSEAAESYINGRSGI